MSRFVLAISFFWFSVPPALVPLPVHAAPVTVASCDAYGFWGRRTAKRAIEWGCGFGPQWMWTTDTASHVSWCLRQPDDAIPHAYNQARLYALWYGGPCRGPGQRPVDVGYCQAYARQALDERARMIARGCALRGPWWDADEASHIRFCMHAGYRPQVENARYVRVAAVKECNFTPR